MDSSDGLVNGEVYWAHETIAYGCSGGQRAEEQQEMVDMSIPTWTRGVRRQEKKSVSPQGSLGTRGGTLVEVSHKPKNFSTSGRITSTSSLRWYGPEMWVLLNARCNQRSRGANAALCIRRNHSWHRSCIKQYGGFVPFGPYSWSIIASIRVNRRPRSGQVRFSKPCYGCHCEAIVLGTWRNPSVHCRSRICTLCGSGER
jgi:hypothetical protein